MIRLKEKYNKEVIKSLKEKFGYKNVNQVPKLLKAVINVGVGRNAKEQQFIDGVDKNLMRISGQKPVRTKAKKSISAFKIRQGMVVGLKVTLRGNRLYDFVEKLIHISFPRIRDFRGLSEQQVDRTGNLTIGFRENIAFPEIRADEIENMHGLEICLTTNAKTRTEGLELFRQLGFPFKKDEAK
jgi:large subunit ribosomal protein L5